MNSTINKKILKEYISEIIKEDEEIQKAIMESSKKYGIPYHQMEKIVSNEINKIFI